MEILELKRTTEIKTKSLQRLDQFHLGEEQDI